MSDTINLLTIKALSVADEAVETLGYGREQSTWLSALMTAIRLDAEHNQGRRVADLATLGQRLASDCANYLDTQASDLRRELDAQEVAK
ncbi:hypothetical protein SAMN04244579_02125 [Azotobacter beijerinckii]|uniref:Uncharacterized protein n=1 Tax=Azotobacter beijerinckii TaxID=170623 RepID=A0A1H6TQU8_9GAMM|nr:hypothetical protein [Azotobacter beijerinckii]SEI82411.1 hypothetical protein SAMN04244579_02125 [Azotobacter beijerinckii]